MTYSMKFHRCNQPGVVTLFPGYAVPVDQISPLRVDGIRIVRQSHRCSLYPREDPVRLSGN